jgi:Na+/glutamate symporter
MGASADEIDRQINSTRDQIDANLDVLERRAASGAKRVGAIAAVGLVAGLAIGGVAYLVYRKVRRPSLTDRLHEMLPDVIADLPDEIKSRLRDRPFKVVITNRSEEAQPNTWESIGQRLAPTVVSSAVGAVMAQAVRRRRAGAPAAQKAEG